MNTLLAATAMLGFGIGPLGLPELIVLAILGVLIFGKRLPEVGKSLGKGIVEFKKGLSGIEEEASKPESKPDPHRIEQSRSSESADAAPAEQAEANKSTS